MKRYCRYHGIMCEYATEYGYCQITACVKRGRRVGMSVVIEGDSASDMFIVSNIKNVESPYIKFQNIYFKCKSIEDAGGTIFVKRKKGKWKYTTHYGERYRVCPFCNAERKDDNSTGWNFCPNCGADMRGEKE